MLKSLQTMCPILFHLVKDLNWREGSLPESFYALLTTLWSKSIAPFAHGFPSTGSTSNLNSTASNSTGSASNSASSASHSAGNGVQDDFLESLSFWPNLPTVQNRGRYSHDNKFQKQACRKLGRPHKSLLPGTVTMHCENGKVFKFYYFYLMFFWEYWKSIQCWFVMAYGMCLPPNI